MELCTQVRARSMSGTSRANGAGGNNLIKATHPNRHKPPNINRRRSERRCKHIKIKSGDLVKLVLVPLAPSGSKLTPLRLRPCKFERTMKVLVEIACSKLPCASPLKRPFLAWRLPLFFSGHPQVLLQAFSEEQLSLLLVWFGQLLSSLQIFSEPQNV